MISYNQNFPRSRFTNTECVFVNQVIGNDELAWSENPNVTRPEYGSVNVVNGRRFKTLSSAFRYAAVQGNNINIVLEVVPSEDNPNYSNKKECFHVELKEPLTITGCYIKLDSVVVGAPFNSQRAEICFDYRRLDPCFLNFYGTYVEIGSDEENHCAIYAGLTLLSRNNEVMPGLDEVRGRTFYAEFHGMGLKVAGNSKIYFLVNSDDPMATFTYTNEGKTIDKVKYQRSNALVTEAPVERTDKKKDIPPKGSILSVKMSASGSTVKPVFSYIKQANPTNLGYGMTSHKTTSLYIPLSDPFFDVPWKDCCKRSTNWLGTDAKVRFMNSLSPIGIDEEQFLLRLKFMKDRGVDHVNFFITDKEDCYKKASGKQNSIGYGPKYEKPFSIYGPEFAYENGINEEYAKIMDSRINAVLNSGLRVVLWMTADDTPWNKTEDIGRPGLDDPEVFTMMCDHINSMNWFRKASAVVVGLECDEYWGRRIGEEPGDNIVKQNCDILRGYCDGKIGVHTTSIETHPIGRLCDLFLIHGDIAFIQVDPTYPKDNYMDVIRSLKECIGSDKPISLFETARSYNRTKCEWAFAAGADSVGNW